MKTKTMKKALSLFLAVLMIALAIPFTLLTVAAEEAPEVKIDDFKIFGKHSNATDNVQDETIKFQHFSNENASVFERAYQAFDGELSSANGTYAQTKGGAGVEYQMCYFDENGEMQYADEEGEPKKYYGIFTVELSSATDLSALNLWAVDTWGEAWMANNGYDIWFSLDGTHYELHSEHQGVANKTTYKSSEYKEQSGFVHTIDMSGNTAKYIAIAVSDYVRDGNYENGNEKYKEMIFYEIVVTGTPTANDPTEPPDVEGAQSVAITKFSVYGRHADEYDTPLFFRDDCGPGRINDGNITTEAQSKNGNGRPYEMCYFNADGVMTNGANPTSGGKSYYGIFVIELEGKSVVDTLSLWTPTKANGTGYLYEVGCMANDAYDIYYSADGETYAAVENASYSDVCAKQSTDDAYYIKDSYNGQTGYVHAIDMGGVTAECIAIAVSGYMPDSGNADYKEMIFYEAVVTGTAPKLMLETGASIRIDEPTGIRFTGLVSKSYVEKLESEGKTVTMGMLITPTNYLEGIEFTKAALDGKTFDTPAYLEIDAAEETVKEDGDYYVIKCVIAKIKEANYDREFSAILYVKVDGEIVAYSDYNEVFNSRSVAEVAEAAYCDLKDAKDDTYKYEVKAFEGEAEVTKYSRYSTTQRDTLYGFFGQREQ